MKKELSIWSAPLDFGLRKPAYRLEPTAGFLIFLHSCPSKERL